MVVVRPRDGTLPTIPPASAVRFERLRQYLGTDSIEAGIGIERGAVETRSAPGRARGLQIPPRRGRSSSVPRAPPPAARPTTIASRSPG